MPQFFIYYLLAALPLLACGVSPEHLSVKGAGLTAFVDASGTISTHDLRKAIGSDATSVSSGIRSKLEAARRNLIKAEIAEPPVVAAQLQAAVNASSNMSSSENSDKALGSNLKSTYDSRMCVDWDYGSGGMNAVMWPCHIWSNQKWYFDGWTIKSGRDSNKCLDYHTSGNIGVATCLNTLNQAWYWSGTNLKTKYRNDTCMKYGEGHYRRRRARWAKLSMAPCTDSTARSQGTLDWYFLTDYASGMKNVQKDTKNKDTCIDRSNRWPYKLIMWECHNGNNQKFYFDGDHLKTKAGGLKKCLEYQFSKRRIVQTTCHTSTSQRWKMDGQRIVSKFNDNCLDWKDISRKDLDLSTCHTGNAQKFIWLVTTTSSTAKAPPPLPTAHDTSASSPLSFIPVIKADAANLKDKQSHMCLDFTRRRRWNGNPVRMANCYTYRRRRLGLQRWYVNGEAIKSYEKTNLCLNLDEKKNRVSMAPCNDKSEQKFYFDGQSIKTYDGRYTTQCMDYDYTQKGNNNLGMRPCTGHYNQRFYFVKGHAVSAKELTTMQEQNMCLDTHKGTSKVYMHKCHNANWQKWYTDGDQLKSKYPNRCLTHDNDAKMWMRPCDHGLKQRWSFNGKALKVQDSNKCLSGKNNQATLEPCDSPDKYQQWLFKSPTTSTTTTYVSPSQLWAFRKSGNKAGCVQETSYRRRTVRVGTCHNGGNQKWYQASIPGVTGSFFLKNEKDSTYCLAKWKSMTKCNTRATNQRWTNAGQKFKDAWGRCLYLKESSMVLKTEKCDISGSDQNFQFQKEPLCEWNSWDAWSACSAKCAGGVKVKKRSTNSASATGYSPCKKQTGLDEEKCNMQRCGSPCLWGNWSAWSNCTVTCGGGTHTRSRKVAKEAVNGGAPCSGNSTETGKCKTNPCPVDCKLGDWEKWGVCSKTCGTGKSVRIRSEAISAQHGGKACTDPKSESTDCNTNVCPVDCEWNEWGSWTLCTKPCGGGTQNSTRKKKQEALNGGKECSGSDTKSQPCNTDHCKVDCKFSDWEEWPACSKTCGGGNRERSRNKTQESVFGGKPCEGSSKEEEKCNIMGCPVLCEWGGWSEWKSCSKTCGGGTRNRTRIKAIEPANAGADCIGNSTEEEVCNPDGCPVDCEWGEWQGWSNCSKECGGGIQTNQRKVKQHAKFAGKACSGNGTEYKKCNEQGCPHDCKYGDWGAWSSCSKQCGKGILTRNRTVEQPKEFGGKECTGKAEETQPCNDIPCPNDCKWQEWNAWSTCSATCGGGTHTRSRNKTEAVGTGKPCDEAEKPTEEKPCEGQVACPVDCKLMPWNAWTPCSVTCGQGTRKRVRAKQEDQNGGKPCPDQSEEESGSCYGAQVDCNDSSITLAPTTTEEVTNSSATASGTTLATQTTEVPTGSYVSGDMQLDVKSDISTTQQSALLKSDALRDAAKDLIADLGKIKKEQVEVVFDVASSGSLVEAGQKTARDKSSPTDPFIIDVTFSIKLNGSSGDVNSEGPKLASELSNTKLNEADFKALEMMKKHKVMCSDSLECNVDVIALSASVTDEPLTGETAKQKRESWPEKVPAHVSKAAAATTTVRSTSCRTSQSWKLVWTALLGVAALASQPCWR